MTRTTEPYKIGTGPYRPVSAPQTMNRYNERWAYWIFHFVTNLVNLFYTARKNEVIHLWREWEEGNFRLQPAIEKVALELYQDDPDLAVEFLIGYNCCKASKAMKMARKMIDRLHTIISHYNAPL